MKSHIGAWNNPSRAHCGAQRVTSGGELTPGELTDNPTCKRCQREAGRRFEIAMQQESESPRVQSYSPLAGEEGRPSYRAPTNAEIIAEFRARKEREARSVEARSVTETDAWGVTRTVGGFGDVGGE